LNPNESLVPTREEFLYFSLPEKLLFYVLTFLALGYAAQQVWARVKLWQTGRPTAPLREGWKYWLPTRESASQWWQNLLVYVLAQKKVRSSRKKSGAPMHLLIFYGFVSLFIATTLLGINTYSPIKFHQGNYYLLYEATFDTLGLLLLVGLVWAIGRRLIAVKQGAPVAAATLFENQKIDQRRYPVSHAPADWLALGMLLVLTLNGYWLEAARISANPKPWDSWSWVGHAIARSMGTISPEAYKAIWWFHILLVLVFFAVLPKLRIRHIVLAIFATAGKPNLPMGKLRTIPMEEVEQTEQVGVKTAKDYSRWHLMSLDACMECGRCTEVCPAWNVGKVLNPKQLVQDARAAMESGEDLAPKLTEEALWQCTTCHACVEACPVLIRHVDLIVDVRRNLVSEGALSGPAATMLRQTASTGNAWGAPANEREKWMAGLEVPLCRDGGSFEYLFWVGCAGATDPAAMKTTRAVAELLTKAGISFACLGREEACTGDPARRTGEEFLFQEKAEQNVGVFQKYSVKKVVTACPHCFNSLKNEYGDFGATMEVFHHTQLLGDLVDAGRLKTAESPNVVFHDPCYLGRVNDEAGAPRRTIPGMKNPPNHSAKTRCCGAGGGRMWMEEPPNERPSNARAEELVATGADTVAMGCPFCRIMLDAAIPQVTEKPMRLVDLAELLQEANQK